MFSEILKLPGITRYLESECYRMGYHYSLMYHVIRLAVLIFDVKAYMNSYAGCRQDYVGWGGGRGASCRNCSPIFEGDQPENLLTDSFQTFKFFLILF